MGLKKKKKILVAQKIVSECSILASSLLSFKHCNSCQVGVSAGTIEVLSPWVRI